MSKCMYSLLFAILVASFCAYPFTMKAQVGNTDYQYALIEAVKQKNLGNLPGAIELYKMVLQANDSVAVAYYELGGLYAFAELYDLSEMNFRIAYELDKENVWFIKGYLDILIMRKSFKEAVRVIHHSIRNTNDPVEYKFLLANVAFMEGNERKSIRKLNVLEREYGVSDKIILLKANVYEKQGNYKAAGNEIEKLIIYFPESVEFKVVAAEMALKSKQADKAALLYMDVLKLDSTNIYALTNLTDYYRGKNDHQQSLYYLKRSFETDIIEYDRKMTILSFYMSDEYFVTNFTAEIIGLMDAILNKHPDKQEIRLFAVDYNIQSKNYQDAFSLLKPLLVPDMKNYSLWIQGILLANALSEKDELLRISTEAYDFFPDSVDIIYFKGIAEYEKELFNDVVVTFQQKALKMHFNKAMVSQTKMLLAESWYRLEKYDLSDSLFRDILKEEPDNYIVMNNFSYYLSLRGESLEEARQWSYKAIRNNPENGTYLDTYAWILYNLGEYKEAEKYINMSLAKGGLNDPDVNEHAAEIHKKLGNFHIARSFYEKAIILGGNREDLENRLAEME